MKILLIGSGGREHALAAKLAASPMCEKLFIAPGNPGTEEFGTNIEINPEHFEELGKFVEQEGIEFIIPGPEQVLAAGIADFFAEKNIPVAGPTKKAAQLESNKDFAKQFMIRHHIPTAKYRSFNKGEEHLLSEYLRHHSLPIVVKASGLAAGKGVMICDTVEKAIDAGEEMLSGKAFGDSGTTVVIEEFLSGIELSVFVITDGQDYVLLPEAKDYKRIGEGDSGPNTGGMGAVSPVPFADETFMKKVKEKIIDPTIEGLRKDNIPYCGFIFFGLIKVNGEPMVIEYNVRMGDPETEVVMPRIESDICELLFSAANGKLGQREIKVSNHFCVTIMLVSGGYPGKFLTGQELTGIENVKGSFVFHAGTKKRDLKILTSGGRVVCITSFGNSIEEAMKKSLQNAKIVDFGGKYYRRDIGFDLIY